MKKAVDPITEMKRELAALTKKVATLEKQLAKSKASNDVTCTSLTVIDSQGKTVANIDGNGNLLSRSAWIAPGPNTRGVWIDGTRGSIQCLKFSLLGRTGNTELVEITGFTGSPSIELRGDKDNAGVRLQAFKGQGGVIDVTDKTGRRGVLMLASELVNFVRVQEPGVDRGGVTLRASYLEAGDGVVYTQDRNGNLTAWMPPRADEKPPKILTEKEILKASSRKAAKK